MHTHPSDCGFVGGVVCTSLKDLKKIFFKLRKIEKIGMIYALYYLAVSLSPVSTSNA